MEKVVFSIINMMLTSKQCAEYTFAGQNTQHSSVDQIELKSKICPLKLFCTLSNFLKK